MHCVSINVSFFRVNGAPFLRNDLLNAVYVRWAFARSLYVCVCACSKCVFTLVDDVFFLFCAVFVRLFAMFFALVRDGCVHLRALDYPRCVCALLSGSCSFPWYVRVVIFKCVCSGIVQCVYDQCVYRWVTQGNNFYGQ